MNETPTIVEKRFWLSAERMDRLQRLAQARQTSEDQLIEQALDMFFSIAEDSDVSADHTSWAFLSEDALRRVWDNDADAAYDNWKELYDASTR